MLTWDVNYGNYGTTRTEAATRPRPQAGGDAGTSRAFPGPSRRQGRRQARGVEHVGDGQTQAVGPIRKADRTARRRQNLTGEKSARNSDFTLAAVSSLATM